MAISLNFTPLCLVQTSAAPYTLFLWLSSHMYIQPKVCVNSQFFFSTPFMRFLATSFFGAHLFRCVALVYFFLKKINFSYNFLKLFCESISQSPSCLVSLAPRNFHPFLWSIIFRKKNQYHFGFCVPDSSLLALD